MLTQAKSFPYGRTRVEAASVPSGSEIPQPCPMPSISRQSASFWFHPADAESARQPARCSAPSRCSVFPVTRFEVRRLAEARLAAAHPIGHPVDHRLERDTRRPEQAGGRGGVHQPGGLRFLAGKRWIFREALAELLRQPAHADLGAADVRSEEHT